MRAKLSYHTAEEDFNESLKIRRSRSRSARIFSSNLCRAVNSFFQYFPGQLRIDLVVIFDTNHCDRAPPMVGNSDMEETIIKSGYGAAVVNGAIDDSRSPALVSPIDIKTPPLVTGKRSHVNGNLAHGKERAGSEPIDPSALSKALKEFEEAGSTRERTPGGSPSRKRQRIYGDR